MAKKNTAKTKKVAEKKVIETVVEPIVEEQTVVDTVESANDEIVELTDEPIAETEIVEEKILDENMGNAIAEELNKKFEDAKKQNMTNRMFGYLWNGQEMDW